MLPSTPEIILKKLAHSPEDIRTGELVTFLNPYSYMLCRKRPELLSAMDRIAIDGGLLVTVLRMLQVARVNRLSFDMTSLADPIFKDAASKGKSLFLIGSTESAISSATAVICSRYPNLSIVGTRNGFFDSESERLDTLQQIREIGPDIVICGMGAVHQESFLIDLRALGWAGTGFTCGGFIHQTAKGGLQYYPSFVNRLGIRWLYRIYDEPKLLRRYMLEYPIALLHLAIDINRARISGLDKIR